jgi:hypothetical protein
VLWADPQKESPKWSEDEGITVKRKGNPKEATVEAWGLVDGQPTSKHFDVLNYDDIVVESSVGTPEMIKKTTDALSNSYNLGKRGGKRRFVGTRYHYNDTYREIMDRGTVTPRLYPATVGGTVDGSRCSCRLPSWPTSAGTWGRMCSAARCFRIQPPTTSRASRSSG